MKKFSLYAFFVALIVGLVWQNKVTLMLTVADYKSDQKYAERLPYTQVVWQQGPVKKQVNNQQTPNVILIVADDLGFNDISTFGAGVANGRVKTPAIDQLASQGAVFEQSYSGHNTCAPSRGMLMTGRYGTTTGFTFTPTPPAMASLVSMATEKLDSGIPRASFDRKTEKLKPPYEEMGLPSSEVTIAEVLKKAGYYTAHIGKWHLGRSNGMTPQDQGFDDSLLMLSGLYLPEEASGVVNAKLEFDPIDQFLWSSMRYAASFNETLGAGFTPGGYLTDYYTDESIRVIKANKNRPFFLYLAHWGVHTPLQATRADYEAVGDIKPHRLRVYAAMIRALDRSVGKIMQSLDEQGIADNTIVMFTSDNGGAGYLGLPEVNNPLRGWKITSFEGGLRVPMFIKWPNQLPAGITVQQPVSHIDVLPTIAAAVGAKLSEDVAIDGENILLLTDQDAAKGWQRQTLYWVSDHSQVVRHGDWKLQLNDRKATDGLQQWLYNLKDDPTEKVNLANERPDKLAELKSLLVEHKANSREPLWPATTQMAVPVDKTLAEQFFDGDEYVFSPN